MSGMDIVKNEAESRYELHVEGELVGFVDYIVDGCVVELPHTYVNPAHGGQGYAGRLANFALEDVQAQGKSVRPTCSYIASYVDKHPEYHAAVAR